MNPVTLYLDGQDGRRSKWFWAIQTAVGVTWVAQGILGVYAPPSKLPYAPWFILGMGVVFLGVVLVSMFIRLRYGRMRVVLSDAGLTTKTRAFGHAEEIPWEDVAGVQFHLNHVDIRRKAEAGDPVTIRLGSYVIGRQVREALQTAAAERGLETMHGNGG